MNRSSTSSDSNPSSGFSASKSFRRFPDKFKFVMLAQASDRLPRPLEMRLSDSSSFFSLGSLGKPLSEVRPTLIRLSLVRLAKSSVRPTMFVLRQLSRLSSVTCGQRWRGSANGGHERKWRVNCCGEWMQLREWG